MSAALELYRAHVDRGIRASQDLIHAAEAPALFTPEEVARRREEQGRALEWAAYWRTIGGARP